MTLVRFEAKDRLDAFFARARDVTRRRALRVGPEAARSCTLGMCFQVFENLRLPTDRADLPGKSQHVPPMAVGVEEAPQRRLVAAAKRGLESRQPVVGDGR